MPNVAARLNVSNASSSPAQHMGAGNFFGAIHGAREQCDAIFTDVRHSSPRKLPSHSHELASFALVLNGDYRERCGRREGQYAPFTLMFRPAGVAHQDEIGPRGVRLYEIELRPSWQKRLADCSAVLDTPRDDTGGGPLFWLAMKLFREVEASPALDDLAVESLLAEILSFAARSAHRESRHAPVWLSRILDKLRTERCRRLTLDELAREAGIHPVHLSRVFRRCVGEGIVEHVHRLRVRTACERLLAPDVSLSELSFGIGRPKPLHALLSQNHRHNSRRLPLRLLLRILNSPRSTKSVFLECGSLAAAFLTGLFRDGGWVDRFALLATVKHNSVLLRLRTGISLRTLLATIVLAVSAAALHAAQNPPDSNATTIVHVTLVDLASGKESRDQTVVLQGERIVSVTAFDATAPAPQGRTLDARGAYLVPGLWDMHVHIQDLEDLPLYIANGVTGVRLMFGVKKSNDLRARLAKEPAAPEVIFGSIIVDGDPPVWPGSIVIHNANDARRVVDEIKESGADFVKIYNGIPRDAYFALVDEARKQNIPFAGHLPYQIRASEASDAGQRSLEHLDGIAIACSRDELRLIQQLHPLRYLEKMNTVAEGFRSLDPARCQALFAQFRRNTTWQVPTLTVHRSMGYMDDSHFTSDPRVAYMSPEVRRRWDPANDFRFRRWTHQEFEFHRGIFNADKQLVGMMFRASVPLLAGTDAMNPYCMPGFSLQDELALLVESGLTSLAALQAATLRPAEFLGRTSELGGIAPGKRADLVLLSADPLADIHNTTQIQAVWLRGKYFDRAALDQLLANAKHRHGKSKLD